MDTIQTGSLETSQAAQLRAPLSRAFLVGLIAFLFAAVLCAITLANNPEDGALAFAVIGTRFSEGDPNGTTGYDGQFAYFIARDGALAVPYIDGPSLRYQRILYPVVSRALSLGQANLVPWVLVTVNLLAHGIATGLLAYLLYDMRAPAFGALIYGLWIGCIFAIRLDLNEPLCFTLAIGAILAYRRQHFRLTIVLLMLSVLAKELGLIFAAGLAIHAFFQGKRQWGFLIVAAPALTFLAWWGVMRAWFGTLPTIYPAARFPLLPLQGMFGEENVIELALLALWLGVPAVVLFVLALRKIWRNRSVSLGAAIMLTSAGFIFYMPKVSWEDPVAAFRVGMPLILAAILFVGESSPRRLPWLMALWLPGLLLILLLPKLWLGS